MIKNKQGSSLIIIIAVVAILSILSLTALKISVIDKLQYIQQDIKMQSYYVARSGADIVAEYIISEDLEAAFIDSGKEITGNIGTNEGHYTVTVETAPLKENQKNPDIEIYSTGIVDNHVTNVQLTLGHNDPESVIHSNKTYSVGGFHSINGTASSNGYVLDTDASNLDFSNGKKLDTVNLTYFSADFTILNLIKDIDGEDYIYIYDEDSPSFNKTNEAERIKTVDYNENSTNPINGTFTDKTPGFEVYDIDGLSDDLVIIGSSEVMEFYVYDKFSVKTGPNDSLKFDAAADEYRVLRILVNELDIQGGIEVNDKVIFYVREDSIFKTPRDMTNHPDDFLIYLAPGITFTFQTPFDFRGRIIGPEATVDFQANFELRGSVIVNKVTGGGNPDLIWVGYRDGNPASGYSRVLWK